MARRKGRKTRPLAFFPRYSRPASAFFAIPVDTSSFKSLPPLSMTLEEAEDLKTWETPKDEAKRRRRRRRPAG